MPTLPGPAWKIRTSPASGKTNLAQQFPDLFDVTMTIKTHELLCVCPLISGPSCDRPPGRALLHHNPPTGDPGCWKPLRVGLNQIPLQERPAG